MTSTTLLWLIGGYLLLKSQSSATPLSTALQQAQAKPSSSGGASGGGSGGGNGGGPSTGAPVSLSSQLAQFLQNATNPFNPANQVATVNASTSGSIGGTQPLPTYNTPAVNVPVDLSAPVTDPGSDNASVSVSVTPTSGEQISTINDSSAATIAYQDAQNTDSYNALQDSYYGGGGDSWDPTAGDGGYE
jgi:hypothetical protein